MVKDVRIFAYTGRSLVSKLIMWWTKGRYSHVSVRVGDFDDIDLVVEAWQGRVRFGDHRQVHSRHTPYYSFRVNFSSEEERGYFLSFLMGQVNKRYDFLSLLNFLWRWSRGRKSIFGKNDKWFCSELIAASFDNTFGKNKIFNDASVVSPSELIDCLVDGGLIEFEKSGVIL